MHLASATKPGTQDTWSMDSYLAVLKNSIGHFSRYAKSILLLLPSVWLFSQTGGIGFQNRQDRQVKLEKCVSAKLVQRRDPWCLCGKRYCWEVSEDVMASDALKMKTVDSSTKNLAVTNQWRVCQVLETYIKRTAQNTNACTQYECLPLVMSNFLR